MSRLLLALLASLGCEGGAKETPAASVAAEPSGEAGPSLVRHESLKGAYAVEVRFDPDPPKMSRLFEAHVTLTDARTGEPIPDAEVSVDAQMPQHGHGMSTQPVNEPAEGCEGEAPCPHPGGRYRTSGMKFHMPGQWTLQIDVKGPKGPDRVVFTYEMPA